MNKLNIYDYCEYCEYCEETVGEDNLTETSYRDADRDLQTMFMCECCIENEVWF